VADNPWTKQVPTFKQSLMLGYEGRECLFGGAAGGGKSSALLMAALQWINTPGYAALLLRRTYTDLSLPGALMDRAFAWLKGTAAKWKEAEKTWIFPSGGRLVFGYLESETDRYRYQSSEYQFIGFDELTQFEESQYLYLFSRLRRLAGFAVPLRMRCASNPGGVGHNFAKQRFLVEGPSAGRLFIPSRLEDNPHLDQDEYRASLRELDPFTRAQLLEGDWSEHSGGLFVREWFPVTDSVPADLEQQVRAWDLAATEPKPGQDPDWSAGVLLGRTKAKQYVVLDVRRLRATPLAVEQLLRRCAEQDGQGVAIRFEEEGGSAGKIASDHLVRNVLAGYACQPVRSTGNKAERAAPLSSMAEAGHVLLLRAPWNGPFLDELCTFPQGAHDDQVDAASLAFAQLARKRRFWLGIQGAIIRDQDEDEGQGPALKVQKPDGEEVVCPVDWRANAPGWERFGNWNRPQW
jgi:predicted phage terminase large subunit-like protein